MRVEQGRVMHHWSNRLSPEQRAQFERGEQKEALEVVGIQGHALGVGDMIILPAGQVHIFYYLEDTLPSRGHIVPHGQATVPS